jgi:hypothetical protein
MWIGSASVRRPIPEGLLRRHSRTLGQGAARSSGLDFTRGETPKLFGDGSGTHRLRLSQPGRVFFTVALLVGVAGIVVARAQGDREGGAPLVVFALLLIGVVTLDAVGRGVVAVVRRLKLDGGLRRHS